MASNAVIVMGSPRSGTSSVAQALHELGLYVGEPDQLVGGNVENADGYWEHKELSRVFGLFEQSLSLTAADTLPDNWKELPRSTSLRNDFRDVLSRRFSGRSLWGWKSPTSSSQVPFIVDALGYVDAEPHFVICVRHPLAVAQSQMKKYGIDFSLSIGVWLWTTLESLYRTRGYPTAVIPFPEVVSNSNQYLKNVLRLVPNWKPPEEAWSKLGHLFKPGLVKNDHVGYQARVASLVTDTYSLAIRCADEPQRFNEGEFDDDIEEFYNRMRDWQKMFLHQTLLNDEVRAYYTKNGVVESASHPYKPNREWQKVSLHIEPSKGVPVPVYFYCLPVYVWIRNASWQVGDVTEQATVQSAAFGTVSQSEALTLIAAVPGGPQCLVKPPIRSGAAVLTVEFMIEHNPLYEAEACAHLGSTIEQLQRQLANASAPQRPLYSSFKSGRKS